MFDVNHDLKNLKLGQKTTYSCLYDPNLLFAIPRKLKRLELGIGETLPFKGADVWNAFELSWLNTNGKPLVGLATIIVPCESPYLIESKSLKLYFNSLNNTQFESKELLENTIQEDLNKATQANTKVNIFLIENLNNVSLQNYQSLCLDSLDIITSCYHLNPDFLSIQPEDLVEETVHSNLLKSNCLITEQPDWGSVEISYKGPKINHEGLLRYIISFRNHLEFHEQCVERIFMEISKRCHPEKLTVEARFTRRGGIDINPYRTTEHDFTPTNIRLFRQ